MACKLIGIDIDGTLIASEPVIAAETIDAVAAAEDAGMRVVLATGRDYKQTLDIWRQLRLRRPHMPLVLVSGALVAEADTARTLYQKCIPAPLACRFAAALKQLGRTAMAYVDPWRDGMEYFLVEAGDAELVQRKWFARVPAKVRRVESLEQADLRGGLLRISSVVADREEAATLAAALRERFDDELVISPLTVRAYDVTIVEATAAKANKWTGLAYVAQSCRVKPSEIVAIGDDANDLPMLRAAGLGIAMPNAPQAVREAADFVAAGDLAACLRDLATGKLAPPE